MKDILDRTIQEFSTHKPEHVRNVLKLLSEEATVPFIARYRKEMTGSMDEEQIRQIRDRFDYLEKLQARKQTVLETIESQGKLTDELRQRIEACDTMAALEDLYLPYKPKRRTRATIAKEKGLEPLAGQIYKQEESIEALEAVAASFVDEEKGVTDAAAALAGAADIIAEWIAETPEIRAWLRDFLLQKGRFVSHATKEWSDKKSKFQMYYDYTQPIASIKSHNMLALRRGEDEGVLTVLIEADEDTIQLHFRSEILRGAEGAHREFLERCIEDAYSRLLRPSIVAEVRMIKKKEADEEAIKTFAANLRELLLAPPAGQKVIMGIDPGYRTGCKVVVVDETGKLVADATIYPTPPKNDTGSAREVLLDLCRAHDVDLIAIGNGTAARETDVFVHEMLAEWPSDIPKKPQSLIVNEAGASVYSASQLARAEFPDKDVTVRGAVSIARRVQDPLAELVKIEPRSIGVGQYQHDVDQKLLKSKLDEVVNSCVNYVGVDLNTASEQLLRFVSGVNARIAKNIVLYRNEHGPFPSRETLKKVPGLGAKTFEQAAGFLRIRGGENPLDASAVHPESYHVVDKIANALGCTVQELVGNEALASKIKIEEFVGDGVGPETLKDIVDELKKPGRDPRKEFRSVQFADGIVSIDDLKEGMMLEGVVTNVAAFGAFVDIGVHRDGLVHVSEIADRFVRDPKEVVHVGQIVNVRVIGIDKELKRISLSMRKQSQGNAPEKKAARRKPSKARVKSKSPKKKPETPSRPVTVEDLMRKFNKRDYDHREK